MDKRKSGKDDIKSEEAQKPEKAKKPMKEVGGRKGPDPVRYGDWENNGIASDF